MQTGAAVGWEKMQTVASKAAEEVAKLSERVAPRPGGGPAAGSDEGFPASAMDSATKGGPVVL